MSVNADELVQKYGWQCLRIEARDLRPDDVLLPAKYRTVTINGPVMVTAVTSADGAHCVQFVAARGARWHRIHGQTEVVVLRAPEKRSPVAVEYPTPQAPTAEGGVP